MAGQAQPPGPATIIDLHSGPTYRAGMNRRAFVIAGTVALATSRATGALESQAAKVYRLGVLTPGARPSPSLPVLSNILPGSLRELKYVEGQNLVLEQRFAGGDLARLPALARELVIRRVDAIVAVSPSAVRGARDATRTIPIVMILAYSDPVALGFAASLAQPGGNITGVLMAAEPTMAAKRLELIKEAVPRAARIAALTTPEPPSRTQVQFMERAAPALGVKLIVIEVRDANYERAFAAMVTDRADALCLVASVILATDRDRIIELAAKHRLPAIYDWREHIEAGGLIAYGGSQMDFSRRVALYVDRIFKGADPATLPIERSTTFELAINLKTAKALGLTIPVSLRTRADLVIE
jgi:putative tryptophan/tyrosine transport system substrate-binding protein